MRNLLRTHRVKVVT